MLFKPELIERIVQGEKTQTRRPVKTGERLINWTVVQNERIKVAVGNDYAVQPGRGFPGVFWHPYLKVVWQWTELTRALPSSKDVKPLRIRITAIRREDVRDISHADSIAEGFTDKYGFLQTWCGFYDPPMVKEIMNCEYLGTVPDHCPLFLGSRPDGLYQAWVYTFEVVRWTVPVKKYDQWSQTS